MASHNRTELQPFGTWLRSLRVSKSLPLRAVASVAEMDQAHLSKVELGQRALTAAQSALIAKFLGVPVEEMEARRIVNKFLDDHGSSLGAGLAIKMLNDERASYEARTQERTISKARQK